MRLKTSLLSAVVLALAGSTTTAFAQPYQDTELYTAPAGVASSSGGPTTRGELSVLREQSFSTTPPDMTGSGVTLTPADPTRDGRFSQSIFFRSGPETDNSRNPETEGVVVFPASVTVLGVVLAEAPLIATDTTWGLAPGVDYTASARATEPSGSEYARIVSLPGGLTGVEYRTNMNATPFTDEFRVLIDHGDDWVDGLEIEVRVTTGDDVNVGGTDGGRTGSPTMYTAMVPLTPECGDGIIEGDEECDDGDAASGDGCSSACVIEDRWACSLQCSVQATTPIACAQRGPSRCTMDFYEPPMVPADSCSGFVASWDGPFAPTNIAGRDTTAGIRITDFHPSVLLDSDGRYRIVDSAPDRTQTGAGVVGSSTAFVGTVPEYSAVVHRIDVAPGEAVSLTLNDGGARENSVVHVVNSDGDVLATRADQNPSGANTSMLAFTGPTDGFVYVWQILGDHAQAHAFARMPQCEAATDVCGDGIQSIDEECDDGGTDALDGCSATCTLEACVDTSASGVDRGCDADTPACVVVGGAPTCVECEGASDCDDGNECTTDSCVANACENESLTAGTACAGGVCDGAASSPMCVECVSAAQCDDGNECTTDRCTAANACASANTAAGTSCTGGVCDGMAMCLGCIDDSPAGSTDSGCSAMMPACDDSDAAAPTCVECVADADCGEGGVCSADNTCEVCLDTMTGSGMDQGCPASAPICAGAAGSGLPGTACQPCLDDTTGMTDVGCELAGAAGPVCDTSGDTNTCVPCEDSAAAAATMDNGCDGDTIICNDSGAAPECVECVVDGDCTEAGTVCGAGNTCVPGCDMMSDCDGSDTPICDTTARECVECLMDSDCMGTETCDLSSNTCEQPDSDMDGTPDDEDLDDDNDGIPDAEELADGLDGDSDDDGVLDYQDPDSVTCDDEDSDGVCDAAAEEVDADGDGIPNHLDLDADGDGITDANEGGEVGAAPVDADGDGIVDGFADADGNGLSDNVQAAPLPLPNSDGEAGPDFLDLDADNDGIPDATEGHDANHDGTPDTEPSGSDTDGDGIDDAYDPDCVGAACGVVGVIAALPDFDEDGAPNYQDADDDDDGIDTATEIQDAMDYDEDGIGEAPDGSDVDGDGNPNWYDEDADNDGTNDGVEDTRDGGGDGDVDANGILDYLDPDFAPEDTDGDGIPDSVECSTLPDVASCEDSDNDGSPDFDDIDDDNDGIPTIEEGSADTDGDGLGNHLDLDADNDGIPDLWENGNGELDANGDGIADDATDSDGDGLLDAYGEPGDPLDTDGDGLPDMLDLDSDADGLLDIFEADGTDSDGDGRVDDDSDTDGDGLADIVDVDDGGSAWPLPDTDDDGTWDFQDADSDDDGVPDATEAWDGDMDGTADVLPAGSDENGNGIDDAFEDESPALPDTDDNDLADWRDPDDDGDGILTEFEAPPSRDTDSDGTPDYLDPDDDGDGVDTADENPDANGDGNPDDAADSDMDGTPDYLDPDNGGDGGDTEGGYAGGAFCSAGSAAEGGASVLGLLGMLFLFGRRRRRE